MKQLGHGADLVAEEASAALILVGWLVSWVLEGKYCTGWLDCWLIVGWLVGERGGEGTENGEFLSHAACVVRYLRLRPAKDA